MEQMETNQRKEVSDIIVDAVRGAAKIKDEIAKHLPEKSPAAEPAADTVSPATAAEPAESKPKEIPAAEGKKPGKISLFGVITALFLAVIAAVSVYGAALSVTNGKYTMGLTGSQFVGLDNFLRFFSGAYFPATLMNSLLLRLMQIAAGLILSLPLIAWVKIGKKPGRTLTKAFLCLAPYCLPYLISAFAVIHVLPRDLALSTQGGYLMYVLSTVLQTAGFFGFCGGFFAYLHLRGIGNGARQGVLVALLVSMLTLLTAENGTILMISNSINRGSTLTLDYYAYTTGLQQRYLNVSSAVSVVKAAAQALIGAIAAVWLCRIAKEDETRVELPDARKALLTFTVSKMIWMVILAVLVVLSFGVDIVAMQPEESMQAFASAAQSTAQNSLVLNGLKVSAIVAGIGGVAAGLVGYSFMVYFRSGRKGLGLAMLIASSALSFVAAEFSGVMQIGLLNTVWPIILRFIADPRLISLVIVLTIVLRMAPERRTGWIMLGLILFAMAFAWGDFLSSNSYAYSGSQSTMAGYLFRLTMQGNSAALSAREGMTEAELLARQAMTPVVSLLVSLPALTLGFGGAAACIQGFKDAK